MSILNFVSLLGGLALFLYGMTIMGNGLEKISGGRLERILERLTGKLVYGVLVGALVTAVIQSSSATTVIVVGFVNAGIMSLTQAVGVIMGANVGTTITAQILRMGDISSDNVFLQMLKPINLSAIIAIIGIVFIMFSKNRQRRDMGQIMLGFAVLFFGMATMEHAVIPLKDMPEFANLFLAFSNPLLGILIGMVVTAVIQSSSASVGILQALSVTGAIPFSAAAPIILGQNIGTTITAVLSGIGAARNARRAALIHVYFNVIGTGVFIVVLYALHGYLPFWNDPVNRGDIANFHLVFNLGTTLIMLPLSKLLVKLATKSIPSRKDDESDPEIEILEPRFLSTPSLALDRARDNIIQISKLTQTNYSRALKLIFEFDERKMGRLQEAENVIDRSEVKLGHYLVSLTEGGLTSQESAIQSELLHSITDFERIGDYIVNLAEASPARNRQDIFSEAATKELMTMMTAVSDMLALTVDVYSSQNTQQAANIEPLEEVIDTMTDFLRMQHIARLRLGECSAESGTLFIEILLSLERIADHCSNIAVNILATYGEKREQFDSHEYKQLAHQGNSFEFNQKYAEYAEKYLNPLKS